MVCEETAGLGPLSALLPRTFQTGLAPNPIVLDPGVALYLGHLLPVGLGVQGCLGE